MLMAPSSPKPDSFKLVMDSPSHSPSLRAPDVLLNQLKRIITSGLCKEMSILKQQTREQNPERVLLNIGRNKRGFCAMDPQLVDSYFALAEQFVVDPIEDGVNVRHWQRALLELDADSNRKLTLCSQPMWLQVWAKGE